jgi:hypothetical protein
MIRLRESGSMRRYIFIFLVSYGLTSSVLGWFRFREEWLFLSRENLPLQLLMEHDELKFRAQHIVFAGFALLVLGFVGAIHERYRRPRAMPANKLPRIDIRKLSER